MINWTRARDGSYVAEMSDLGRLKLLCCPTRKTPDDPCEGEIRVFDLKPVRDDSADAEVVEFRAACPECGARMRLFND